MNCASGLLATLPRGNRQHPQGKKVTKFCKEHFRSFLPCEALSLSPIHPRPMLCGAPPNINAVTPVLAILWPRQFPLPLHVDPAKFLLSEPCKQRREDTLEPRTLTRRERRDKLLYTCKRRVKTTLKTRTHGLPFQAENESSGELGTSWQEAKMQKNTSAHPIAWRGTRKNNGSITAGCR